MNSIFYSKAFLNFIPDLLFKYLPLRILSVFKNKKQLWLFTERPIDARDNGWVLYKWLVDNHPEINVVYAIHKKAQDYDNVKDLGKVVEFGSWKHWYYFMLSSICCGTQWDLGIPNTMCFLAMRNILRPKSKRVFLQHGITKDYMSQGRKCKLFADIFVCGAYPEWKYISDNFGYHDGEVKYLGFARFDRLINSNTKQQILYMPTWRAGIGKNEDITITIYYKRITSLLSSKELNSFLKNNNIEFVFYLHPAIRNWKHFFTPFGNDKIKILNNDDYDLQKLICSANLLITDFSSIYFDFAYLNKPVIYYQFDYEDYRNKHYKEGYFDYLKDGFGPIENEEKSLIDRINSFFASGWKVSKIYEKRVERFFPIRDNNNCQRHFDALCELEKR